VLLVVEEGADPHTAGRLGDHRPNTDELIVSRLVVDERALLPAVDEFDAVVFASSNTVRRFLEAYPAGPADGQYVASIGPSTTATARKLGLRVDAEAGDASPAALVALLMQHLGPAKATALPGPA
jgi:uroporphyrinogen-III synthase